MENERLWETQMEENGKGHIINASSVIITISHQMENG